MSRRALTLALAAALITGSALGLIGGILLARQWFGPHAMHELRGRGPGPGGPPPFERGGPGGRGPRGERRGGPSADAIGRHLRDELSLTDAQTTRIVDLIRTSRTRVDAERDSLHANIGRTLTPDQRQRWERMPRPSRFPGPPPGPSED